MALKLLKEKYWLQSLIGGNEIINSIEPTAIIDQSAQLGNNISIGPNAIIEHDVSINDNTSIAANAHIKPYTTIGKNCKIFNGAILGEVPQDLKFEGEKSELIIVESTTIREYCTLNRGTNATGKTIIGNECLLMAYVHIAHDCIVGNNSILANSVQVGGHVEIGHHVTIGGMTPIHQFCKIGNYSFTGGGFRIVQDIPPYILAMHEPLKYSGLNVVGLRRNNFSSEVRKNLKAVYQLIFNSSLNLTQAINKIKKDFNITTEIQEILDFIENSDRGLI